MVRTHYCPPTVGQSPDWLLSFLGPALYSEQIARAQHIPRRIRRLNGLSSPDLNGRTACACMSFSGYGWSSKSSLSEFCSAGSSQTRTPSSVKIAGIRGLLGSLLWISVISGFAGTVMIAKDSIGASPSLSRLAHRPTSDHSFGSPSAGKM